MARASTRTLLPLDTFAKIAGINPLHFNQVVLNEDDPTGRAAMAPNVMCGEPILQYSWQGSDKVGREEIAQAIAEAEAIMLNWLSFTALPDWVRGDRLFYPSQADSGFVINQWRFGYSDRWDMPNIKLSRGYVHTGGVEAKTLIDADATVTYTDLDSDTYFETATIGVVTTVTEPSEIAIYYPGHSGEDAWEIRPIKVSITAGIATITARREQFLIEKLQEDFVAVAADGLLDANFLTEVDVYRHYTDVSQQVTFLWSGGSTCGCGSVGCAVCGSILQPGCMLVRDSRRGLVVVSPGDWDATLGEFSYTSFGECRVPDRLFVNYKAGWIDPRLGPQMYNDPEWERAITYLALSLLDRPLCSCERLRAFVARWAEDLATTTSTPSGGTSTYRFSTKLLDNPIGTSRAALHVWRLIQRERLGEAIIVGRL